MALTKKSSLKSLKTQKKERFGKKISFGIRIKPKGTLFWTNHAQSKMNYYHISEGRVKRIINTPKRIEEGIAPKTIAMMQSADTNKNPYEIWVMTQKRAERLKIISVWRYPGITKPGEKLPDELIRELKLSLSLS